MLGTIEKNRTVEYQTKINMKSIVKDKVNKLRLIDEFLKSRLNDPQGYKVDHEDELK